MTQTAPFLWSALKRSVRGVAHVRAGLPNQDAIAVRKGRAGAPPVVLAVADGHGSPRNYRSAVGAKLAVRAARDVIWCFLRKNVGATPSAVKDAAERNLPAALVRRWREKVNDHLARYPTLTNREARLLAGTSSATAARALPLPSPSVLAYGTTLLVVAIAREYLFYLQLGDGDILAVSADPPLVQLPVPGDPALIANETYSLCQDDAVKRFRFRFQYLQGRPPPLILAATDGYANSFASPAAFQQVGSDLLTMIRRGEWDALCQEMPGWLAEASQAGSGDDITVGLLYCRDAHAPAVPAPASDEGGHADAPGAATPALQPSPQPRSSAS